MKNNHRWTIADIPDQRGRIALITGANSGLGFQETLALAQKGATVIMACRNIEKAEIAANKIREKYPDSKLHLMELDLSDLNSITACAKKVSLEFDHLDLLINNAGVMIPPLSRTKQGFELQFGTNHLGHFALTAQLLPMIEDVNGARIVSVSSVAAYMNYIDFNDLNYEFKKYRKWLAYCQSKLANQMFMTELAGRLSENGNVAIAVAAHPGVSSTDLFKSSSRFMKKVVLPFISHTPDKAALSILRAACDPSAENGSYWGPSGFLGITGSPGKAKLMPKALNPALTKKLWKVSEELTIDR
ncbi:SDR family NAD(P)-dependent oxidoreductase [Bacteroidales bacterium OttesenSCG-928-C03]|nr:SDR family NAD(P)-dependent oxidoreductase [Bacteroidales bacterium OttesenSCG-928-C03]